MQMPIFINEDVHAEALAAARQVGAPATLSGNALNAPLGEELLGWIERLWDQIEAALRHAWRESLDAARPFVARVEALSVEVGTTLKQRAEIVRSAVRDRLYAYIRSAIDGALERVSPIVVIGGNQMRVIKVNIEQHLKLSTSLKVSLEEICKFIAEGELSISAEYGAE